MSDREFRAFTRKIEAGLRLAEIRMLEDKAMRNETVVVSREEGVIQYIPAKDVLDSYPRQQTRCKQR